jgi:enoyl-CoA hydratase
MSGGPVSANVTVRGQGRSAEVVLGSGGSANALGHEDWQALELAFRQLAQDEEIRVVVVRGSGSTFSAGSDLREWVHAAPHDVDQACDLRVFADDARIGMPIARLGILVSPAFAARLALLAGHGLARELLYTGRLLDAAQAVAAGLANRRVPSSELADATAELAAAVAAQPRAALVAAKQAVSVGLSPTRAAADSFASGPAVSYEDFQRGVTAFLSRSRHHSD